MILDRAMSDWIREFPIIKDLIELKETVFINPNKIEAEKAIPLRYAENLNLSATEDYTIARLRNPWDTTRILHTYVLVDKEKSLPADLPEGTLVRTPLSKAVVYSSVHCGLLNQIGAL